MVRRAATMTDALLVIALLALAVLPLSALASMSALGMQGAAAEMRAAHLASTILEEELARPPALLADRSGVHPDYPGYTYQVAVTGHPTDPGLRVLRTVVSWRHRGQPRRYELVTLRSVE